MYVCMCMLPVPIYVRIYCTSTSTVSAPSDTSCYQPPAVSFVEVVQVLGRGEERERREFSHHRINGEVERLHLGKEGWRAREK